MDRDFVEIGMHVNAFVNKSPYFFDGKNLRAISMMKCYFCVLGKCFSSKEVLELRDRVMKNEVFFRDILRKDIISSNTHYGKCFAQEK